MSKIRRFETVTDCKPAFERIDGRIYIHKDGVYCFNGKVIELEAGDIINDSTASCDDKRTHKHPPST